MPLFSQQLDQLIRQSQAWLDAITPSDDELPEPSPPLPEPSPQPEQPPAEVETTQDVDLVWFDRGINLDEIEMQSAYRNRRKISSLDV